ncbi:hypothetical protein IEQ34_025215 [Dendrobium chrysotoxum]|uniref:Kinesin-like protein n=1 Tax=Dendrobium chrysotoxum TaxID=161865 RepID=A0AAV7FJ44_DENCH|nr:hypothetical protein IEQ34_025215 [Dendrobium chrysotoxum]
MNPPKDAISAARARVYATSVPTKFTFSRVFAPPTIAVKDDAQADFFRHTTLPLVDELLQGQSGLIFTYGVTNSGKSYTVQGESGPGQAGILPRSADVIFNSIQDLQSTSDIRPVGLSGVERSRPSDAISFEYDTTTKVRVDRNYRYSVWVSYVEVYNEKIFDLLDVAPPTTTPSSGLTASISAAFGLSRSDSYRGSNWALAASSTNGNAGSSDSNSPILLQRKPLSLKNDIEAGGKYVAGLQEIRVRSPAEARELMRRGQDNRRVFATMANRASSRSHGVFTLKVIREHGGEQSGTLSCTTSRLSIVDLAGSERLGNTSASGDRLKEAGSINKSLMCLGQCIETLRKNQNRAASFIPAPISPISSTANVSASVMAARVIKRRPSIVPFRHSKLTELFQSFFTGEGRAVMIVNVNPYDTGFDENSHVMRFSAAAKEVHTVRTQAQATNLTRFVHPSLRNLFNGQGNPLSPPSNKIRRLSDMSQASCPPTPKASTMAAPSSPMKKNSIARTPSTTKPDVAARRADRSVQAVMPAEENREVTIIEASDEEDEEAENDSDPFVEHLMQRYEQLREQLFESELRCAMVERQVREEMAEEMAQQLQEMQNLYSQRMLQDAQHNEDFVNRKLDLLARASHYQNTHDDESAEYESAEEEEEEEEEEVEVEEALARTEYHEDSAECSQSSASTAVDDASVIYKVPRTRTARRIEESEEEASDQVDSTVDNSQSISELEESSASIDLPSRLLDQSAIEKSVSSDADATHESQMEESDPSMLEESEDEEEGTSDESFDVTDESIESSFEAAPRARASRARTSVRPKPATKAARATTTTMTSKTRKEPTTRRRTTAATTARSSKTASTERRPFGRSSAANISQEVNSDASLILDAAIKKSPKKRLLGRKTIMDEETMIERTGDSSLVAEI